MNQATRGKRHLSPAFVFPKVFMSSKRGVILRGLMSTLRTKKINDMTMDFLNSSYNSVALFMFKKEVNRIHK